MTDPEITLAYCRAYNRWLADFCRDSAGHPVPIAHLTLIDPEVRPPSYVVPSTTAAAAT